MKPEVSIIIPCIKNSKHLNRILPQIKIQTYKKFEVIVMDGSESVSEKRNKGFSKARGEWIIFIDDDTNIPQNWLKEFMENKRKDAIIGGVVSTMELGETDTCIETCNVMIHRTLMEKVKFDTKFNKAAQEDYDWCLQAKKNGYKLIRIPNACLHHLRGGSTGYRLKKQFKFGVERVHLEKKWGKMVKHSYKKYIMGQTFNIALSLFHLFGIFYGIILYKILRKDV